MVLLVPLALLIGALSEPALVARYIPIQLGFATLALLLATYLHCFHLEEEAASASHLQQEDRDIRQIAEQARTSDETKDGERL
jgi:hypothetical protein